MNARSGTRWAFALGLALSSFAPRPFAALVALAVGTVGIGHGALDHLVPERLGLRPAGGSRTVAASYAVLAAAALACYAAWPLAGMTALVLLGAAHFAAGDAAFADERPRGAAQIFVFSARAISTVGLPVLAIAAGRSERRSIARAGGAVVVGIAVVRSCAARRYEDALDLGLPALALLVAPAPAVFGAYFAFWHSPRHLSRLLDLDPLGGPVRARLGRAIRAAAPIFIAVATTGAALVAVLRPNPKTALVLGLGATFALTVPHECIVLLMDRADRKRRNDQRKIAQPPCLLHEIVRP